MPVVEGGGAAPKKKPTIGNPSYVHTLTWGGVTFVYNKKTGIIKLAGSGKQLPKGSTLNVSKKTIDLPNGKHLSFNSGKVIENTPIAKRDKLAPTKYTQKDYLTGRPAAPVKQPRSGDDNRQPMPVSTPKPAPAKSGSSAGGASRAEVMDLQRWLNSRGAQLEVDGIYGPKTKAAEAQFGGASPAPAASAGGGGSAAAPARPAPTGPTAPAPPTKPLDPKAVADEVRRMFGEVAAFLDHPELGPILRKAQQEGWDQSRLFGALQQTKYWRTTPEDARKWMIVTTLDPASAKSEIGRSLAAVSELARQNALSFTPDQMKSFAENAVRFGWTGPQIREFMFAKAATGAKTTGALDANVAQNYGYLAAFLDEPQVGDLLRRAAREGWTEQRLEVELRKTDWWKTTSEATRRWDALKEQSPEDAQSQSQNRVAEISAMAQQFGIRIDSTRLEQIAEDSMRYGWSQTQIKNAVTREYEFGGGTQPSEDPMTDPQIRKRGRGPAGRAGVGANEVPTPEGNEFGVAGQTIRQIKEMAGQYLVPISPQMLERWTEQIIRGETDMEGFNGYLVEQAKSLFPGMANALDRGVTVAQYADPYKQIIARELELNPESIDLNDPKYRKVLDQVDDKGNRVSMTLSEAAEYVRTQPEWQQTRGANEKGSALTEALLQTFGKVA